MNVAAIRDRIRQCKANTPDKPDSGFGLEKCSPPTRPLAATPEFARRHGWATDWIGWVW